MYPLDQGSWGPTVRIGHLRDELSRLTDLDIVAGHRGARRWQLIRYALSGRLRGVRGVYVENSSSLPSETDIAFLALARMLRIPALTYVRDAQYLFPEYYQAAGFRRRLARSLFRPAIGLLRAVSSRVGYPSAGLARAVGDAAAMPTLLPPGSPTPVDVPRRPDARSLLFVGPMRYAAHGLDLLVEAVDRVRSSGHAIEVICVSRPGEEPPEPRPAWLRVEHVSGSGIHDLLPGVLASVTPRRRSPYNDLAVPIKVMEYLSYGRPLIVTDCIEQAEIVRETDSGLVAEATVDGFAEAITTLLTASADQVERWSSNARAAAVEASWASRARTIVGLLAIGSTQ
jgi:glycosyltransferase involved in cell wall biosynthesis